MGFEHDVVVLVRYRNSQLEFRMLRDFLGREGCDRLDCFTVGALVIRELEALMVDGTSPFSTMSK
jgi:hypothetical protein